jgi:hypothetical protein
VTQDLQKNRHFLFYYHVFNDHQLDKLDHNLSSSGQLYFYYELRIALALSSYKKAAEIVSHLLKVS